MFKFVGRYYFVIVMALFAVFKFPHLFLPYFWDEAWSYFPAIAEMAEKGPGLLPGALSLEEGKGHPLFFFWLTSTWISLNPGSLFFSRLLPLAISLALLFYSWHFARKTAGMAAGNLAITLLAVQSLFLAQATFLLPEVLLAFLLLVSADQYIAGKFKWYALAASLMVLTKETAIVFVIFFLLWHILSHLDCKREKPLFSADILLLGVPLLVYASWLVLHFLKFGTFFYSEHVGHIQFDKFNILMKLETAGKMVFIQYGRWLVTAATLLATIWLLAKKRKSAHLRPLLMFVLLAALFMGFSAVNFYTQRYMMGMMALFIVTAGITIAQARTGRLSIDLVAAAIMAAVPLYYSLTDRKSADSDLGFVEVTAVHHEMVRFCEQNGWQNEPISSSFNMIFNLRDKRLGYLSGEPFTLVRDRKELDSAKVFITESTGPESPETMDFVKQHFPHVKVFRNKHAYGEIYYKPD